MAANVHSLGGFAPMALDAAQQSSGLAFLVGELEKRDPTLLEPLTSITWARDIEAVTGGGYVDFVSNYYVDYATIGANQFGIVAGNTTQIPIIQANISKDTFPVYTFANIIRIPFLDQQKMSQIGRSLDQIYDEGLRLNHDKTLDQNTYLGFSEFGTYGILNHPSVTSGMVATGASTYKTWANKTPTEILSDVNTLATAIWAAGQYSPDALPNHVLIPPAAYGYISTTPISAAGTMSIMTYLMENNICKQQGRELRFFPCRQTLGIGTPLTTGGAATNRMAMYIREKRFVDFDMPVPLTRALTQPSVEQMAFLTGYISLHSILKIKYFQTIQFADGL